MKASDDLRQFAKGRRYRTILADPPWQFTLRRGKVSPEHQRLARYPTLPLADIMALPVATLTEEPAHLYLWVPNSLLAEGLRVMEAWGFTYKTMIVWHKIRKDGGSDGRGVGFYFRNVTETLLYGTRYRIGLQHVFDVVTGTLLFGTCGKKARTLDQGRSQVNFIPARKREHSRKPDEQYDLIEACSRGPYLELFARGNGHPGWSVWGNQAIEEAPVPLLTRPPGPRLLDSQTLTAKTTLSLT